MEDKEVEYLRRIVERSDDGIRQSRLFISLFSGSYKEDPIPLLQLGLAIIHDKPIALIVLDDEIVPENLKKIAVSIRRIKRGDEEALKKAVEEITSLVKDLERNVH